MTTHHDAATDEPASVRTEEDLILAAIRQESHPRISRAGAFPTPEQIGPYTIVREIGAGGMGIVYEARQEWPLRRTVALKVIKRGMDTRAVVSRFEAERQALAMLDHPNIAHIFEAGSTEEGQPYFSMELVHGVHITKYCDEHHLGIPQRLALFVQACDAIQHAHQKGIIHRDIKPSNVLVDQSGDEPLLKIIDFGIAKAADHRLGHETILTEQGQLVGTPEYMSPEHTRLTDCDIDTRTDVYSLGVLLYELLVGELPYDRTRLMACSFSEVQRIICEEEPPHPSERLSKSGPDVVLAASRRGTDPQALRRRVRGDLNWITMKALEKDRDRRYSSVANLAADVDRHLKNEPVSAGPPSRAYRARKFVRRNRMLVTGVAAFAALLLVSLVLISALYLRALEDRRVAQQQTYYARIAAANGALRDNDVSLLRRHLGKAPPTLRNWEWWYLNAVSDQSFAGLDAHREPVWSIAFSLDGRQLATGSDDHTVRLWQTGGDHDPLADVRPRIVLEHEEGVYAVAFSPDGRIVASTSRDMTVRLWNASTGLQIGAFKGSNGQCLALAFDPRGYLAWSDGLFVRVWDVESPPRELIEFDAGGSTVYSLDFSHDGSRLAVGLVGRPEQIGIVGIWQLNMDERTYVKEKETRIATGGFVRCVLFSPTDDYLVFGSKDGAVRRWPLIGQPEPPKVLCRVGGVVQSVAFSSDGTRLAIGADDQAVRLWDMQKGEQLSVLRGHSAYVQSVAFSPTADFLASTSRENEGNIRFWDLTTVGKRLVLQGHPLGVTHVAFGPDGVRLASVSSDR